MAVTCYRDLEVWKLAVELTLDVYRFTAGFPSTEKYGLASQLQRSAASVPANIAEGHGTGSTRQFLRHISLALGSLAELETHLAIAKGLQYGNSGLIPDLLTKSDRIGKMMRKLQGRLKTKIAK